MKVTNEFLRRRWFDFRQGHGLYLIFIIAFIQFVILSYTLALERIEKLKEIFPDMWMWGAFFIMIYLPSALIIGYLHRKHQMPTEAMQNTEANPYLYKTQPGKEQLYSLPAALLAYEQQLKSMEMTNKSAELWRKIYNLEFPVWSQEEMDKIRRFRDMTDHLMKGQSIKDEVAKGG